MSENWLSNTAVGFVVALAYETAGLAEELDLSVFDRSHPCHFAAASVAAPAFAVAEYPPHL